MSTPDRVGAGVPRGGNSSQEEIYLSGHMSLGLLTDIPMNVKVVRNRKLGVVSLAAGHQSAAGDSFSKG